MKKQKDPITDRKASTDRVNLRQIRAFHAVMVNGSLTAAAASLHLSQPAVSKHLSSLEHATGLTLFTRQHGSALTPTREGGEFFKAVEGILTGLVYLSDAADDIRLSGKRRIRIAGTATLLNSTLFTRSIFDFTRKYPNSTPSIDFIHRLQVEEMLVRRQIDLAFALITRADQDFKTYRFLSADMLAAVPSAHPLADRDIIYLRDLKTERLVMPARQPMRNLLDAQLALSGVEINRHIDSTSSINCWRLASAGVGIALIDPLTALSNDSASVVIRRIAPAIELSYGAITLATHEADDETADLINFCHTNGAALESRIANELPRVT